MSSGQSEFGKTDLVFKTYYHLHLTKKDWCSYFKECPIENNIGNCYCWVCKYRRDLDIPDLLCERGTK